MEKFTKELKKEIIKIIFNILKEYLPKENPIFTANSIEFYKFIRKMYRILTGIDINTSTSVLTNFISDNCCKNLYKDTYEIEEEKDFNKFLDYAIDLLEKKEDIYFEEAMFRKQLNELLVNYPNFRNAISFNRINEINKSNKLSNIQIIAKDSLPSVIKSIRSIISEDLESRYELDKKIYNRNKINCDITNYSKTFNCNIEFFVNIDKIKSTYNDICTVNIDKNNLDYVINLDKDIDFVVKFVLNDIKDSENTVYFTIKDLENNLKTNFITDNEYLTLISKTISKEESKEIDNDTKLNNYFESIYKSKEEIISTQKKAEAAVDLVKKTFEDLSPLISNNNDINNN